MRLLLRFCASCAFLRPSLLVLFAAFAGHLAAQPAPVLADPTTGALYRPGAATFASYNNLLTLDGAAGSYLLISTAASTYLPITVAFNSYQQLDADLTSWAAVVRAGGFDTFVATPSSANLATLVTGETGSGALVFGTSPTFTTPTLGAATATSITAPDSTNLTLAGGSTGASLVLGQGTSASATLALPGVGILTVSNVNDAGFVNVARFLSPSLTSGNSALILVGRAAAVSQSAFLNYGYNTTAASTYLDIGHNGTTGQVRLTQPGNLLIGTTTDATSLAGGLVVNGSGAGATSSSTSTGALRVTGGVGVSGAMNVGGAATFAGAVTIGGTVIHTLSATPASATAAGTVGTMSWDANYIYICTATNTWKRVAIATW
jgi:hypothetical protein